MTNARPLDGFGLNKLETRIRRARRLLLYTRESDRSFERRLRLLMRLVKERENARH
jgi:hypothetical protein